MRLHPFPRTTYPALALAVLAGLLFLPDSDAHAARRSAPSRRAASHSPGPWIAEGERGMRAEEESYEQRHPLLRDPLDANRVPGPRGLVARIRTDATRRPRLELLDERHHEVRRLGGDRRLSQPRWSPDGRRLAATQWRSADQPWQLCVLDAASGAVLEPPLPARVSSYRWSPNGEWIAAAGVMAGRPLCVLALVSAVDGSVRMLDTLAVFADHEFSWSADSRALAVVRPAAIGTGQETLRSELWIIGMDGAKGAIVQGEGIVLREPRWIDHERLSFVRTRARGTEQDADTRVVRVRRR